jgi:hypothetical protein
MLELDKSPVLGCALCSERFSEFDVAAGLYFVSTHVCLDDYIKLSKSKQTCFAKEYDPESFICRTVCPDNKVCKQFMERRLTTKDKDALIKLMRHPKDLVKKSARDLPFTKPGSVMYTSFMLAWRGTTLRKIIVGIKKSGNDVHRVLRTLRRGYCHGYFWDWDEDNEGNIKITYPAKHNKD